MYIGQIFIVPFTRGVPTGALPCDGRLVSVTTYEVLYSVIGTIANPLSAMYVIRALGWNAFSMKVASPVR